MDLQQQLESEQARLLEICPDPLVEGGAGEEDPATKAPSAHQLWQEKLDKVIDAVQDVLNEGILNILTWKFVQTRSVNVYSRVGSAD